MSEDLSQTDRDRPSTRIIIAALIGLIAQLAIVLSSIPLGIPGEWEWHRFPPLTSDTLIYAMWSVFPFAATYLAICWFGLRRIEHTSRKGAATWLALLVVGGFIWLWGAIDATPQPTHQLGRGPLVHFFPAFSGYYDQARNTNDLSRYLTNYEDKMSKGDVLHLGTHPPGLIIIHRGILNVFRQSPSLTYGILATCPRSAQDVNEQVIRPGLSPDATALENDAELAALWFATLTVMAMASMTTIPLYCRLRTNQSRETSWKISCFFPLAPALILFIPKSDVLLACTTMSTIVLWQPHQRNHWGRAIAAGFLFWGGMLISLATLSIGLVLLLVTLQYVIQSTPPTRSETLKSVALNTLLAGTVFTLCSVVFSLTTDANLWKIWEWNLHNHSQFYSQYSRTYANWLAVNPLEMACAVGLPFIATAAALWKSFNWRELGLIPVFATLAVLWISGKNSGETARLWILFIPCVLWGLGQIGPLLRPHRVWVVVLGLQMIASFATAIRVCGFDIA